MSADTKKPAQKFAVLISHGRRRWFADNIFDDPVLACGCAGEYLAAAEAQRIVDLRAEVFELVLRGQFDLSKSKSPSGAVSRFSASASSAGGYSPSFSPENPERREGPGVTPRRDEDFGNCKQEERWPI